MNSLSLAAVVLAIGLAACGGSREAALDGRLGSGDLAGNSAYVGEAADYTAFARNTSGKPVELISASLIPLRGFPAPRLTHVAVEAGQGSALADRGWPPEGGAYDLRRLRGYIVRPRARVQILYAVVGDRVANYADKGIRVNVRETGASKTVDVLSGAATCVMVKHESCPKRFVKSVERAVLREGPAPA